MEDCNKSMPAADLHLGIQLLQRATYIRITGAFQIFTAVAVAVDRQAGLVAAPDMAAGILDAVTTTGGRNLPGAQCHIVGLIGTGRGRGGVAGCGHRRGLRDRAGGESAAGCEGYGENELVHGVLQMLLHVAIVRRLQPPDKGLRRR